MCLHNETEAQSLKLQFVSRRYTEDTCTCHQLHINVILDLCLMSVQCTMYGGKRHWEHGMLTQPDNIMWTGRMCYTGYVLLFVSISRLSIEPCHHDLTQCNTKYTRSENSRTVAAESSYMLSVLHSMSPPLPVVDIRQARARLTQGQ